MSKKKKHKIKSEQSQPQPLIENQEELIVISKNSSRGTIKKLAPNKILIMCFLATLALLLLASVSYAVYYGDKVIPRTMVAGSNLAGRTLPQSVEAVRTSIDKMNGQKMTLKVGDKSLEVHPADIGLVIDANASARQAYIVGKRDDLYLSVKEALRHLISSTNSGLVVTYDQDKLNKLISNFASGVDQSEVNAGVKIVNGQITETQGIIGHRLDQDDAKLALIEHWQAGQVGEIKLSLKEVQPQVKTGDTKPVLEQADKIRKLKFILTYSDQQISPKQETVDSWISSEVYQGKISLALKQDLVKQWLDKISPQINQDPQEARLSMQDGKISIIKDGGLGKTLDSEKTANQFVEAVRAYIKENKDDKNITVSAVINTDQPVVTEQSVNSLGIVELIGTATTSFTSSPENRKHNIAVGAAALTGIVIKPGEEFSTLRFLGHIDGAAGYLPELVIKDNSTVPDFGGGLCQVSTTLFRAAMNSGLPITERQNHSYRVPYYEPPVGMDATIYEGSPDLKFVNDTSSYILVQSHIDGAKITFDFYGKKDGRQVKITDPVVYNVTNPPDPIYTQTDSLPEGTTKQTDHAHPGADATFTYTVFNADGSQRTKSIFNSHYVPWPAKFSVGTGKTDPGTTNQ